MENPGHAEACEWGAGVWVLCQCTGFDTKGTGGGVREIKMEEVLFRFQNWRAGL